MKGSVLFYPVWVFPVPTDLFHKFSLFFDYYILRYMPFSFSRLIISEADTCMYKTAVDLIETNYSQVKQQGTASCVGTLDSYNVWLGFRKGVPSCKCSCVENIYGTIQRPCSHVFATSILWDRSRNIPDPSQEDIEFLSKNMN